MGGSALEHLPLAQVMVPGSQNQVPHRAPCMEPASPSACVYDSLSVCVSHKEKIFKKKKKRKKLPIGKLSEMSF